MALFEAHTPGSMHLVLHAVCEPNPERGDVAEWWEPQLARRCTELCGKQATRQLVGMTLRAKLLPRGLVTSRKQAARLLLWSATEEASGAYVGLPVRAL